MILLSMAYYPQSNVKGSRPIPLFIPKTWFTTALLGAIQQTQVKYPSAGKMKSGNQYQQNDAAKANMKNLYLEAVHLVLLKTQC